MSLFVGSVSLAWQQAWPPGDAALALLVAFAETSLRATPLLALALAGSVVARRGAPALRHAALALALGASLSMPLLLVVVPGWEVGWITVTDSGASATQSVPGAWTDGPAAGHSGASATHAVGWSAAILAGIWVTGSAVLLARLGVGLAGLVRLGRQARNPDSDSPLSKVSPMGTASPWAAGATVVTTAAVAVPAALAGRRWRVLLPLDAAGWKRSWRRAIVAHELAHLRRRDPWTLILAALTVALHWPNPLVWLAARHLRQAAEEACDQAALETGIDPVDYAEALVHLARRVESHGAGSLLPAATGPGLARRVEVLLRGGQPRTVRWALLPLLVLCCLLAWSSAAVRPSASDPQPAPGSAGVELGAPAGAVGGVATEGRQARAFAHRFGIDEALAGDILHAAQRERVEASVAFGLVRVESGFDAWRTSPHGAVGLTQILPSSAASLEPGIVPKDLYEPRINLRLGLRLLRDYQDRFGGDQRRALLAYSLGPRRVAAPGPPPASEYPEQVLRAAALAPAADS